MSQTMRPGNVDVLSSDMALGWASAAPSGADAHVYAWLDSEVIGAAVAHISRPDLEKARTEGTLSARAFAVVFDRPVPPARVADIQIISPAFAVALARSEQIRFDPAPPLRIFVCGAPRSGTSQLGATLASAFKLPWLGECHAARRFAEAADALGGDANSPTDMVRFLSAENYRGVAVRAAKEAYFFKHGSASFIDKTPGVEMINAVPFLHGCFPDAYFIFAWRNPVANLLSRMVKFGGDFEGHCRDWALAMQAWVRVRGQMPHYLEVRQEDMQAAPAKVAADIATYLQQPDAAADIAASLSSGTLERTGAGIGKTSCAETQWTPQQIVAFSRLCEPAYRAFIGGANKP